MNVTYACPRCESTIRGAWDADTAGIVCSHCQLAILPPAEALDQGRLRRCLVCPSTELFVRKDFPQRLGVAIVVAGFIASSVAWYYYMTYLTFGILFATALFDVLLLALVGNSLVCYRCGAEYRDVEGIEEHGAFNLETHERYRQQAARLGSQKSYAGDRTASPASNLPVTDARDHS